MARQAGHLMPTIDRLAIYERDQGLCGFCGQFVPMELLHLDHYPVPRAMGGPTVPENLRVAHRRCNIQAGKAVVQERRRLGLGRVVNADGSASVSMRVSVSLMAELRDTAREGDRSLNAQVVHALREWLAARRKS